MNLREFQRRYGWWATCHYLAYRFAQRVMVLDVTHLLIVDVSRLTPTRTSHTVFRPLCYDELKILVERSTGDLDESIMGRLRGNRNICMGAIQNGCLAGYYWLAFDSIEAIHNSCGTEETGVALSFPADTTFGYNALVLPTYRGQGLYEEMVRHAGRWAQKNRGTRYLIATADWSNHAALRSCQRQGTRSLGLIWRFGFRCVNRFFTLGPQRAALHGIRFGKAAQNAAKHFPRGKYRVGRELSS